MGLIHSSPVLQYSITPAPLSLPSSRFARIRKFTKARKALFCLALFFCCFRLASGLLTKTLGIGLR
jgi:hypothetical protein